jgi:peptidoglycan DL-endopeptidase RipA
VAFVSEQPALRRGTRRWLGRTAGIGLVVAACLGAAPGLAAAQPTDPGDGQISAAQSAADAAAQQMGAVTAQIAASQAKVDDAHARAALALDQYEGKQEQYETAQKAAQAADAAAEKAEADLDAARAAVASFARDSYMSGSTDSGMQSLLSSGSPAQMLERAALLDAAGDHRSDVVAQVTVAEKKAQATLAEAKDTLTEAAALKQQAAGALASANALEVSARQEQASFQAQQATLQAQLDTARQKLAGLKGARAAAQAYAAQQAAVAAAAARAASSSSASSSSSSGGGGSSDSVQTAGAGSSSKAQVAINAARRWIGQMYAWGGGSLTGPSEGWGIDAGVVGFDCSGLTRYAYAQAGIAIPRQSTQQYVALPKVSRANLRPGDLVFYAFNTSNPSTIHHVAMYLGGNQMIEAPESGEGVHMTTFRTAGYIGAVRPTA